MLNKVKYINKYSNESNESNDSYESNDGKDSNVIISIQNMDKIIYDTIWLPFRPPIKKY